MNEQQQANDAVRIDVQAVGVRTTSYLEQKIEQMVSKLKAHSSFIDAVEVRLRSDDEHVERPRTVVVRCSIPGDDVAATDTGLRWKLILKNVEKKLLRQLEKKKALFRHAER